MDPTVVGQIHGGSYSVITASGTVVAIPAGAYAFDIWGTNIFRLRFAQNGTFANAGYLMGSPCVNHFVLSSEARSFGSIGFAPADIVPTPAKFYVNWYTYGSSTAF